MPSTQIKPRNEQVAVRTFDDEQVSEGGIVLPDVERWDSAVVEVVALGTSDKLDDLKVGDQVFVSSLQGGHEINEIHIIDQEVILGIL